MLVFVSAERSTSSTRPPPSSLGVIKIHSPLGRAGCPGCSAAATPPSHFLRLALARFPLPPRRVANLHPGER